MTPPRGSGVTRMSSSCSGDAAALEETGDMLTINVGGVLHTSTKSTLRKSPFFAALFDHTMDEAPIRIRSTRDDKGRLFVDRDGGLFSGVLSFLRSDRFPAGLEERKRVELEEELRFFGLEPPVFWPKETILIRWSSQGVDHAAARSQSDAAISCVASTEVVRELCDELAGRAGGCSLMRFNTQIEQLTGRYSLLSFRPASPHAFVAFLDVLEMEIGTMGFKPEGPVEASPDPSLKQRLFSRDQAQAAEDDHEGLRAGAHQRDVEKGKGKGRNSDGRQQIGL
mmetsp:Transcript_47724/g.102296  ORF Transcript_47724/g.102296 Transcript_47724/m.102296 type:complete len:282 (+) Transcript_47724:60-905(+)